MRFMKHGLKMWSYWAECIKQAIACKQLLQAKAQARLVKGVAQAIA